MRSHAVAVSGSHLGERGTIASLRDHLGKLRTADVVQAAARLTVWLEKPGRGAYGATQDLLVAQLFPPEIAERLLAGLTAGGRGGGFDALFFPGQLLTLQRLALAAGQPGPPTSFDRGTEIGRFVLAAAQVNDIRETLVPVPANEMDDVALSIYAMRASEINRIEYPPVSAGRAYRLWVDSPVPWPAGVEDPETYCQRLFGVTFHQFIAIAAAPAIGNLQPDLTAPGSVAFNPATYFESTTVSAEATRRVLAALTFSAAADPGAIERPGTYWCLFDMADRPLLPCGVDLVLPCSIRYALERATTGVFWMLHAANAGAVGPLTQHFGKMFEAYCLAAAERLVSPTLTVSAELEYGSRRTRRRSSDVLITSVCDGVPLRLFIECRAGRPPRQMFETGDRGIFDLYVGDIVGKLGQIDRCIRDHISGAFDIPNDLAGSNDTYVPILVLDEPFQWTFTLKAIIDREVQRGRLLRDPRVARPIVCSIGEFEGLISACERGANIAQLLLSYLQQDRMDALDVLLFERTGPLQPPTYCSEGWDRFHTLVIQELFR